MVDNCQLMQFCLHFIYYLGSKLTSIFLFFILIVYIGSIINPMTVSNF